MRDYSISKLVYNPSDRGLAEKICEMSYKPPIDIIQADLRTRLENGVMQAIQQYDIFVDKDELLKALAYDRDQYKKGFEDGCNERFDSLLQEERVSTASEMLDELELYVNGIELGTKLIGAHPRSIFQAIYEKIEELRKTYAEGESENEQR